MRNNYFIPEPYANEKERLQVYRSVLLRERPIAKRLWAGITNYQYYTDTSIGTIFFEIKVSDMGEKLLSATEPAQTLIKHIRL